MKLGKYMSKNLCKIEKAIHRRGIYEHTYKKGFWEKRFFIWLASPDSNSGRTLVLNPISGIKILSWHKGQRRRLEQFFANRYVWPEW